MFRQPAAPSSNRQLLIACRSKVNLKTGQYKQVSIACSLRSRTRSRRPCHPLVCLVWLLLCTNLLIYQAKESSLVPAGFLTAQFLQKNLFYEAFLVMGPLRWYFSTLIAWRAGKVETSLFYIMLSLSTHSLCFKKSIKRSPTLFPQLKQMLHKTQFLQ